MDILFPVPAQKWDQLHSKEIATQATQALEKGHILLLPNLAFELSENESSFLTPNIADPKSKNISYRLIQDKLSGAKCSLDEKMQLKIMMRRFVQSTQRLIENLLPHYQNNILLGRTSFRPVEIAGRKVPSYRKDDTRLHVDAFPSSPNQGRRILRVFTNINPYGQHRLWKTGEPFAEVAKQFLPKVSKPWPGRGHILKALKITKSYCTDYDFMMLEIHNRMKASLEYQKTAHQNEVRFAPGSTWIVQTDHVSHAALEGQHVLEQTFYLPVSAMLDPTQSPLKTLEKLTGRFLV